MKKKTLTVVAACLIVAGIATSYGSPYLTMYELRSAMKDKDADVFSSHVDFPSLRESVRAQFMMVMQAKMGNSPDMKGNAFAGLGMMMAMGIVNQVIDTMVTPAGVMTMMAQGTAKPVPPVASQPPAATKSNEQGNASGGAAPQASSGEQQVDYSVSYKDWSTVNATARQGTEEQITFVFKRDGLWSWKLAGVKLPVDKLSAD